MTTVQEAIDYTITARITTIRESINDAIMADLIKEDSCEWRSVAIGYDEDDAWLTKCDATIMQEYGSSPEELGLIYCSNCGRKIEVVGDE